MKSIRAALSCILLLAPASAFIAPQHATQLYATNDLSTARRLQSPSVTMSAVLPPPEMFKNAVNVGAKKASLPASKIFTLGVLSGCHIGFGALLALSVGGNVPGVVGTNPGLQKIIFGLFGLPFGLYMTLVGGGELFTGNTALVTAAVLEKKATLKGLAKSWSVSFIGNLVGSILLAALVLHSGIITAPASFLSVATAKTSLPFMKAFLRGILCNWLVCMAVYMSSGISDSCGKLAAIVLPISAFVALGTDHSVANMFIIPMGMMLGAGCTVKQFLLCNLLPVTLGNIVGGAVAVAGMYYAAFGNSEPKQ